MRLAPSKWLALRRWGWATFLFYIAAFLYYLYVRIRYTIAGLGAGYEVYGIALLVVECLGASTIILFGLQMLWDPLHEKYPEDPNRPGVPQVQPSDPRDCANNLFSAQRAGMRGMTCPELPGSMQHTRRQQQGPCSHDAWGLAARWQLHSCPMHCLALGLAWQVEASAPESG